MGNVSVVLALLNQLLALVPTGSELYLAYKEQKAKLEGIVSEGRDPTDAEWDALDASVREKEAFIDRAAASL